MLKQFSLVFFVLFACYVGVNSRELKHITKELEVDAPAYEAWELYRNLGLINIIVPKLPNVQSTQVLKGDGGIGTVAKTTFVPAAKALEGDCLAFGCSVLIVEFDIKEKSQNSCIIKSIISYAVKKEFEAKDPKPTLPIEAATQASKEYLERETINDS
uniref:Bet v I/Major latex protein domain-containing protein n=1 Tax=Gossypium raimondii TaxID=29730 RepID=A0A0D2TGH9_GOSRA|nr:hypothetical protein B456_009G434300 [Gossypium raimondii]